MNTKIGTSFGLAVVLAIGAIATMFALGMFQAKPANAAIGSVTVTIDPTKARSVSQYTIDVTGGSSGISEISVGGNLVVTFDAKTTVPSSIAASAVTLKSSIVTGTGTANQLVNPSAVTVSGKAVTLTIPDMDPSTASDSLGDQGIAANAAITITFNQAAGITNANTAGDRTLTVKSSADGTAITSGTFAVTNFVSFTPTTAARGTSITVTGGGFGGACADCKIRFNPQDNTAPTTGTGNVAFNGSGSIDANGVFTGTIDISSTTSAGGYVWVTDAQGNDVASTKTFVQKAGATPTVTTAKPGQTVSVDLVDFTASATLSTTASATIGGAAATSSNVTTVPSSGNTAALTPYKFVVPSGTNVGTHQVKILESGAGTKSATFNIDIVNRELTVSPATAVPGQSITISGTGFTKSGTIAVDGITARASGDTTDVEINYGTSDEVDIDSTGAWSFAGKLPTLEAFASQSSNLITITATDSGSLVGESTSAFSRTPKTLTLSPTTASPGESVTVSVTGFTADNGATADKNAEFEVTISGVTLTGTTTFPIALDGSGTGTFTLPSTVTAGTKTVQVEDNASTLNPSGNDSSLIASGTRTKTANLKVPNGTVEVSPASASTGQTVTVSGSGFPPSTTGSVLNFGDSSGLPSGGFTTDASGTFSVAAEVPAAAAGGSLSPGATLVKATVGTISGSSTGFSVPSPSIVLTPAEAAVEETVTVTGTGFSSLGTVSSLKIGSASVLPSPAPRAARNGDINAEIVVPLLNAGTYTVVMENAAGFSASTTFKALAAKAPAASSTDATETVFADVIAADDNLVRVWRFSNATQSWDFYDPRPAFADANTLAKTGAGDIVWVNVNTEQTFQAQTLFPGWNLISLK